MCCHGNKNVLLQRVEKLAASGLKIWTCPPVPRGLERLVPADELVAVKVEKDISFDITPCHVGLVDKENSIVWVVVAGSIEEPF